MPGRAFLYSTALTALALHASSSAWAAPAPLVDTKATSTSSGVSREQLENLPVGRRLEDLIRTCPSNTIPTVSRSPDVLIDGKPLVDINCVQPADIEMIEVLNVHNGLRSQYGAPPLAWDPVLVQGAQGYVNQLSRSGQLVHASREGRGTVRENLSQGLPNYRARQLMDNWLNERRYFFPGTFPNVSTTGDWYQVGHYSQMIWPTTTTIGCARGVGAGSSWLVCRYDPGGNKDGKPVGIPVKPQQVASAPDATIRPRLIGGDYGGKIAQGQAPNTELPWHPDFNPRGKRPEADQGATSLFDLGIYGGIEPWDNSGLAYRSFDRDPDHEYVGLSEAFAEIRIPPISDEYGYDGGLFVGYDMGSFRLEAEVAYKKADLESFDTAIRLPGEPPPPVGYPAYGSLDELAAFPQRTGVGVDDKILEGFDLGTGFESEIASGHSSTVSEVDTKVKQAKPTTYQWIDTKTGKPVPTVIVMPGKGDISFGPTGKYHLVTPDPSDPNRAYDPVTGRNFAREDGSWIDTKTGEPVPTVIVMPGKGDISFGPTDNYHLVTPDPGDPTRAYDPVTGRNFAKEPATENQAAAE